MREKKSKEFCISSVRESTYKLLLDAEKIKTNQRKLKCKVEVLGKKPKQWLITDSILRFVQGVDCLLWSHGYENVSHVPTFTAVNKMFTTFNFQAKILHDGYMLLPLLIITIKEFMHEFSKEDLY